MPRLAIVNMLWMGSELGPIQRLSIASFLRQGHSVRLHSYGNLGGVPSGVTEADASAVLSYETAMSLRHQETGSYAIAADLFRLKLMERGEGLWSDSDMLCVSPIEVAPSIFGWEGNGSISNALLYLEKSSPILRDALGGFRPNHIPSWYPLMGRSRWWRRKLLGKAFGPADLGWGMFGPVAMTKLATRHRLTHLAAAQEVFFPLPYPLWHRAYEPGSSFDEFTTEHTKTIHLWNLVSASTPPHPDSAVGRFARELQVA